MSSPGSKRPSTRPRDGVQSRAATGRGAGRACCGDSTGTGGAQDSNNDRLHQTCRPVSQFEHVCVEECPLTTRHTAERRGDSCGESHRASAGVHPGGRNEESQTMATNHDRPTRRCSEQTRAERRHGKTSGTRPGGEEGPLWTIAGNRTEQSRTKGAVCRPSRLRLQRRGVPSDAQEWPQTRHGGVHDQPRDNALHTRSARRGEERVVLSHTRPCAAREACGREHVGQHREQRKPLANQGTTLRRRCVYGARGVETDALAKQRRRGANTAQARSLSEREQMDDLDEKKLKERTHSG